MTTLTCHHCSATTTNGLMLCELCQAAAEKRLEFLPIYFRNLTRWRPGRSGSRTVPGSRAPAGVVLDDEPRTGTGDRISDRLDDVLTALTDWAMKLARGRTFPRPLTYPDALITGDLDDELAEVLHDDTAETVRLLCLALEDHLTLIATLEWCGLLVTDLGNHEQTLRTMTEAYVPGWYAGGCRRVVNGHQCDSGTYVVPGLTWVTCQACGTTTYARDHLDAVLDEAREWIAPPKRLAEAVVALIDGEHSVTNVYARIRKWAERGHVTAHHRVERGYAYDEATERMVVADNEVGQARYRFGDVLDHVWARSSAVRNQEAS